MRCTDRAMNKRAVFAAIVVCLVSLAFTQDFTEPENHGIVVANMDRSVKPGDNFYRYANGTWIERTEIPPDRNYIDPYGTDFDDNSNDLTRKRMAGLIEEAAKANAPAGSNTRRIADLYHSYMDEATIEAKALARLAHTSTPLLPFATTGVGFLLVVDTLWPFHFPVCQQSTNLA
jgi:putative endopeptidase